MADDGFYHGLDDTDNSSDTIRDADEEMRKRAEYEAKVNMIMGQYNAAKGPYRSFSNRKTDAISLFGNILRNQKRRHINKNFLDEISTEPTDYQKAEWIAKADQIRYNRSKGGGYSNGGYSQYEFIGEDDVYDQENQEDSFSYYSSYEQGESAETRRTSATHFSAADYYPHKKVAGVKDGRRIFLPPIVIGAFFVLLTVLSLISGIVLNSQSKAFIASADKVTGTVDYTLRPGRNRTQYHVRYTYQYNDKEYQGSDSLTFSQANELGLVQMVTTGRQVTVYVDPDDPGRSMLAESAVFSRGVQGIIFSVIGIVILISGIVKWLDFKNGRMLIVETNGRKKFKKI